MTADRSRAYAHVMAFLADLGPAKLHDDEQAAVRHAADSLFFCTDIASDDEARNALHDVDDLADRLVEADRLMRETADALLDAVAGCGPAPIAA